MTDLERAFLFNLNLIAPELKNGMVTEHRFHPIRKWRLDFAWPAQMVAVECEGGIFRKKGGAHRSISGILRDIEKYNAAVEHGWHLLRLTAKTLNDDPDFFFDQLANLLIITPQVYPGNCPDTPQERAAAAGWIMCLGYPVSTRRLTDVTGLTPRAAQKLMENLCRVLPIYEREPRVWAKT
jgi:very-short-patch-repair endonuclease